MTKKAQEPTPVIESGGVTTIRYARIGDETPLEGEWVFPTRDMPRPLGDEQHVYLLLTQTGQPHRPALAPGLYRFYGWGWGSEDIESNDRVDDSTVVAWAALPVHYEVVHD